MPVRKAPIRRPAAKKKVVVRKHKRRVAPKKRARPTVPVVRVPGMATKLIVEGDVVGVDRTPTTFNIGSTPKKPIVKRKK